MAKISISSDDLNHKVSISSDHKLSINSANVRLSTDGTNHKMSIDSQGNGRKISAVNVQQSRLIYIPSGVIDKTKNPNYYSAKGRLQRGITRNVTIIYA